MLFQRFSEPFEIALFAALFHSFADSLLASLETAEDTTQPKDDKVPWEEYTPICEAEQAPAAPEEKPLTLEEVRAVLAELSRAGHTAEVKYLLKKHGASKLSDIDPSEYPFLLAEAEVL